MKTKQEVKDSIMENLEVRLDRFLNSVKPDDTRLEDDEWDWEFAFIEWEFR